jgi:LysM repeat protein
VVPGPGVPSSFNKPAGGTEARPAAPSAGGLEVKPTAQSVPQTNFDVDLYDPKATDTYESISQDYYNETRYAAALRAYNGSRPLQGGHYIDVPPIHVLKKKFPTLLGTPPAGATGAAPRNSTSSTAPNWGAPPPPAPVPARATGNARGTYVVPSGGMTMQEIAPRVGVKWYDIWDLNSQYAPNFVIAAGTELKMPPNAQLP